MFYPKDLIQFKMTMEKVTNQKKIILDYLKSVKTHPSVGAVYRAVKKKLPQISLGTVYRILNNLKAKGEIQEIPNDVKRYDGDVSFHSHFICEKCERIYDVFDKCPILKAGKLKVGKIKSYQVYFYGDCKNCQ